MMQGYMEIIQMHLGVLAELPGHPKVRKEPDGGLCGEQHMGTVMAAGSAPPLVIEVAYENEDSELLLKEGHLWLTHEYPQVPSLSLRRECYRWQ